jgi:integrase
MRCCRGAFKQAMVWGWISHNPVPLTTRPAVEPPDHRPPEVGQAERLIETAMAEDSELGLFLVLAVVLGARRGELCSLRWSDVDFDQGDVLVAGAVIILPGQPLLDRDVTKTRTKRRVAVGPGTLELLRARRVERAKAALAAGVALGPDAYVFSRAPDGSRPIRPRRGIASVRRAGPPAGDQLPAARPAALHGHSTHLRRRGRAHRLGPGRAP